MHWLSILDLNLKENDKKNPGSLQGESPQGFLSAQNSKLN